MADRKELKLENVGAGVTVPYDKLVKLLGELFQFDREDLDFGIYRILNHKLGEISRFLNEDLLPQVEEAFRQHREGDETQKRERMAELEKEAARFNADPEQNEEYRRLKTELEEARGVTALENEVYSDLYTFFRRYYKDGDFLSLRRYKPGVYAVPYEGEEVKLHWANADQYYVKTAENFRNYRFEMESVGYVNFDLAAATTERDNNKPADGKEGRFVLREEDPVEVRDGELRVYFEYRLHPDKQEDLRNKACDVIFENVSGEWKTGLAESKPTQSNKKRTLLEKHLAEYTARNTFDYFIHKDLGGFLRRELDFFLKNEVLHIDDLDTENEQRVEQYLSKLKVIKRIGRKIITFLAQIEDFQKKLFLKKKFVVSSDYCLTLDNVPEELYEEIVVNDAQYEEWERLFSISEIPANLENGGSDHQSVKWFEANPYLVLDTKHFSENFKDRLLASIKDLDENTDGLLINSENFQALNLLQERYREGVRCIYIDPPYNKGDDDFLYKDNYQHSSWLSMLDDRLLLGRRLAMPEGVVTVSVDDIELDNLLRLLKRVYGEGNELATLVWDRNRKNDATFFSVGHEYMIVYAVDKQGLIANGVKLREQKPGIDVARAKYTRLRKQHKDDWDDIRSEWFGYTKGLKDYELKGILAKYPKFSERGPYRDDGNINWPGKGGPRYEVLHPNTGKPCKVPKSGWRYSKPERFWEEYEKGNIAFGPDETTVPGIIYYLFESTEQVMGSVFWSYAQTASDEFVDLFGDRVFENPKNWRDIRRLCSYLTTNDDYVLDYFAGSGTTGHAVINLNREDDGRRKYILVEMGEYFDSVLKKRIQKVIYSKDWKDGKPASREGTSHIFKYMTLESYEDTLNNLSLKRTDVQDDLIKSNPVLREEYMLSYMLDFETKGSPSLLNLDAIEDPFSYKLNITRDDETRPEYVDLIETFNYLLGLTVSRTYFRDGCRMVEGTNPAEERVLVIWRNTKEKSNDDLEDFFEKGGYTGAGFDRVYANGDNTLDLKARDSKVHLIEEEFRRLMFETEDF